MIALLPARTVFDGLLNLAWYCAPLLLGIGLLPGCAHSQLGDQQYQPTVGQHGKDVIWVPTPDHLVVRMLEVAQVKPHDLVIDLGAGDGKIPIQAARQFGAQAIGIEYNPDMANLARRNVQRAGVADKVRIITGDIFVEDFSKASVLTMYLLPSLNQKLKPHILKMKPGTRVVSHSFDMEPWEPDQVISAENSAQGYFWVVPAPVHGTWKIQGLDTQSVDLQVNQRYQKFDGRFELQGKSIAFDSGRIHADEIRFTYQDHQGNRINVVGKINGTRLTGEIFGARSGAITGQRLP